MVWRPDMHLAVGRHRFRPEGLEPALDGLPNSAPSPSLQRTVALHPPSLWPIDVRRASAPVAQSFDVKRAAQLFQLKNEGCALRPRAVERRIINRAHRFVEKWRLLFL